MAYFYHGLFLPWPIFTTAYFYHGLFLPWPIFTMAYFYHGLFFETSGSENTETITVGCVA